MKPIRTLVLVADDGRARLYENAGPGKGLTEIEDFAADLLPEAQPRPAVRPGRNSAAPGMARHSFAEEDAEHDRTEAAFARALVAETDARFAAGGYDRFLVAAAPRMLGSLRTALPARLRAALIGEKAKDFVNLKPSDLARRLADDIAL